MNNINNGNQRDSLLPPPELLKKYDEVYKGLSSDLLEFVKKEQQHRHKIQDKYLMQFRIGQIVGIVFLFYIFYAIFNFLKLEYYGTAYSLLFLLSLILLISIYQYKSNKVKTPNKGNSRRDSYQKSNNMRQHARNNKNNNRS